MRKDEHIQAVEDIRSAFLSLLADGNWQVEYDGDTDDRGHTHMSVTHILHVPEQAMKELCELLGIEPKRPTQTLEDAIQEAIEG